MTATILVTGANKGIGLAIVQGILEQQPNYGVLLGARDPELGAQAREQVLSSTGANSDRLEVVQLDVSDQSSVNRLAASLQDSGTLLYGLVNNAGTVVGSLERLLSVNTYGVRLVSETLLPLITDGGRIVNVSSASGPNYVERCSTQWQKFFTNGELAWAELDQFMQNCVNLSAAELEQQGLPADYDYGFSKACASLYSMICARENPRLTIHACTPGFIETDLTREMTGASGQSAADMGMKQPVDGAKVVLHLLFAAVEGSGHYFGSDAKRSPLDCYRAPGSPAYTG